jgi:2-oxoglutarate ferredoxin oxidoreductase subunit alpha
MGVPVSPRNIFPSNIQGLPTWYEVRVSERGWLGRRGGGVDLMVAMNPQTWDKDVAEVEPGGYLFYDSTKPLPPSKFREDINVIGMPLMEICNQAYSDPRQRQLFKNIIYVGALAALLDIDIAECEKLIGEQYKGKEKLLEPNIKACIWAAITRATISSRRPSRCGAPTASVIESSSRATMPRRWVAFMAAPPSRAWYPITPVVIARRGVLETLPQVQDRSGHQEGALRRGAGRRRTGLHRRRDRRRMERRARVHVHSGPGISLMQEFIGLAYFAEIPAVIIDVQRAGPSTGMPTRTQQSDLLSCAYASHGDTKHVLLFPEDPERGIPVLRAGLRSRRSPPDADLRADGPRHRHERSLVRAAQVGRLAPLRPRQGSLICGSRSRQKIRALPRCGRRRHHLAYLSGHAPETRIVLHPGTSRDRYARYTEEGSAYVDNMQRLLKKFETAKDYVPKPVVRQAPKPSRFGVIYYGSTSPAMDEALAMLDEESMQVDAMRVRAFPFHDVVLDFINHHEHVFVVEQNRDAQLRTLLVTEAMIAPDKLTPVLHYDGTPITARFIHGRFHSG